MPALRTIAALIPGQRARKIRTPTGIFVIVQRCVVESIWSDFIPYTATLSSLSGLITVPLSSNPANRPLLREYEMIPGLQQQVG